MPETHRIHGRTIDPGQPRAINGIAGQNWAEDRPAISRIPRERLNRRRANGLLKEQACRALLIVLKKKGEIKLPPRVKESPRFPRRVPCSVDSDTSEIRGAVTCFDPLAMPMVRFSPDEALWDLYGR